MGGVIVVFICVIGSIIWGLRSGKKQPSEMGDLTAKLGLKLSSERDYQMAERYAFLEPLQRGSNRYALNVIRGKYQRQTVIAFDYHYETHSPDSNGEQQTDHHSSSFFILTRPRTLQKKTREQFLTTVAQSEVGDLKIETDQDSLALVLDSKLAADQIETHLNQLIEIGALIPAEEL